MRLGRGPGRSGERGLLGDVRRGAVWEFANVAFSRFGQFALGVLIARIISPNQFGIFAVALVVQAVVMSLNELGVSEALTRGGEDRRAVATVTTVSVLSSSILAVAMYLASPALAGLMNTPEATPTLRVLSLTVVLAGFAATPIALLRRDFQQDRQLAADASGTVVQGIVVVLMALLGFGALALAWSRVAGQATTTVILQVASPERFRLGIDLSQMPRLLRFGLPLAMAQGVSWLVVNADYVVISRTMGSLPLGYYLLAFNISGWPLSVFGSVVRAVALPAFGRLRADREALARAVVAAVGGVATITFPVCFLLGALAQPLVHVVYGPRWAQSAAPLMTLALFTAVRGVLELFTGFTVAHGRTRVVLYVQLAWLAALVPALVLGSRVAGLAGVGAGQTLVAGLVVLPAFLLLVRSDGLHPVRALAAALPAFASAALAAALAFGVSRLLPWPLLALAAGGLVGVAAYGLLMRHHLKLLYVTIRGRGSEEGLPAQDEAPAPEPDGAAGDEGRDAERTQPAAARPGANAASGGESGPA